MWRRMKNKIISFLGIFLIILGFVLVLGGIYCLIELGIYDYVVYYFFIGAASILLGIYLRFFNEEMIIPIPFESVL